MFAVVEIAGSQIEVSPKAILDVPHIEGNPGDKIEFSDILVYNNDNETFVGSPYIKGKISAKILDHFKDDKVLVFKKKRRKGYRKLNGHRQMYTKIEITKINIKE